MTITERVENAIGAIIPIYSSGVDFSYAKEPARYAIYSLMETSTDWGEGKPHGTRYSVTVNVFTEYFDLTLYGEIKQAMITAGFSPISGGEIASVKYPATTQYYLDFSGVEAYE